jgi:ABC-2 type transport system ATP-binding protein
MPTVQAPARTTLAVEAENLAFAYADRPALDSLSLRAPAGSVFGLLGPNGSGKSTLLSLLAGLRTPAAGSILVLGEPPSASLRSRIGFLFQATSLDPLMTVWETLSLHGRLYAMHGGMLSERIDRVLRTIELTDRAGHLVRTLSGGMKRRLELGRALLPSPDLLLLDEPTTGLDPDSQQTLWEHLLDINRAGVTILVATNNVREADARCDEVAFIHRGRIVAQGSPGELKAGLKRDGIWVEGDFDDALIQQVSGWPDVGKLTWAPPVLHATVDSAATFVPRLFQTAGERITSVRLREATLEDTYFDIVGTRLSNGAETA